MVNGITIQNSPQTHLKFDNCVNIQVSDFTTSSPGDSPNTDGIHTREPVRFACSDSLPCTGISLSTIELKPATDKASSSEPFCWEAHGELKTETLPPIQCLKTEKSTSQSSNDAC